MTTRSQPNHCPYCGDDNLWPHQASEGAGHGEWECRSCLRAFKVSMIAQLPRPVLGSVGSTAAGSGGTP